jgi:hypothetical protein
MKFYSYLKENKMYQFTTKKDQTGHTHDLVVDDEGNGKTVSVQGTFKGKEAPPHVHKIKEWNVQPSLGHMHTIDMQGK